MEKLQVSGGIASREDKWYGESFSFEASSLMRACRVDMKRSALFYGRSSSVSTNLTLIKFSS